MLTFYTSRYTPEDMEQLKSVLETGLTQAIPCDKHCPHCKRKRVCSDIYRVINYINRTLEQREN